MIDERKTKAYHDRVIAEISKNHRKVDYFTRQAERCKKIYAYTKNRGGIYRLIHGWAKKKNQHFCKEGTKLALNTLKVCVDEFDYLDNYLKNFKEES